MSTNLSNLLPRRQLNEWILSLLSSFVGPDNVITSSFLLCRAALVAHFSEHPVYKAWAPEVIRVFAEYATSPLPDGSITLKTSKYFEAVSRCCNFLPE
jgi:hypothetical protein